MINNNRKIIIFIIILVFILGAYTYFNTSVIRSHNHSEEDLYENKVSKLVSSGQFDDINYNILKKDLDDISNIIKEQIIINLENSVEEESYIVANNIYTEKMSEFNKILSYKLDDDKYKLYIDDLDAFEKNLTFGIESRKNEILSEYEIIKFRNEYSYTEKQRFLYEMLEKYKSYLE